MNSSDMRANAALCRAFAETAKHPALRKAAQDLSDAFESAALEIGDERRSDASAATVRCLPFAKSSS
jgi:hypothetical protein